MATLAVHAGAGAEGAISLPLQKKPPLSIFHAADEKINRVFELVITARGLDTTDCRVIALAVLDAIPSTPSALSSDLSAAIAEDIKDSEGKDILPRIRAVLNRWTTESSEAGAFPLCTDLDAFYMIDAIPIAYIRNGRYATAKAFIQTLPDREIPDRQLVVKEAVNELLKNDRFEEAIDLINMALERGWVNDIYLCLFIEELLEKGRLTEAEDLVRGMPDGYLKNDSLRNIAMQLAEASRFDEAKAIVQRIRNDYLKNDSLRDIAMQLAKASRFDEAAAIVRGMPDDYLKNDSLRDIAMQLAKASRFDEAAALIRAISTTIARSLALSGIADIAAEKDKMDKKPLL